MRRRSVKSLVCGAAIIFGWTRWRLSMSSLDWRSARWMVSAFSTGCFGSMSPNIKSALVSMSICYPNIAGIIEDQGSWKGTWIVYRLYASIFEIKLLRVLSAKMPEWWLGFRIGVRAGGSQRNAWLKYSCVYDVARGWCALALLISGK